MGVLNRALRKSTRQKPQRIGRATVRGVELATRQSGGKIAADKGRVFVWAHGLLSSMAQEDAVRLLDWSAVAAHARLIRYDARSHGRSALDSDPSHLRWPELALDMLGLLDAFAAPHAVLGGVSMGCATALHAAVAAPKRVSGLVLVAPPTAWETRPRQAAFYRVASTLVGWTGLTPFRLLASLPGPGRNSPVASLQGALVESLAHADADAVMTAMRGAADSDLPDPTKLAQLHMPALILAWRGDPTHPVSTAARLSELLPRSDMHVAETLDDVRAWPLLVANFVRTTAREVAV